MPYQLHQVLSRVFSYLCFRADGYHMFCLKPKIRKVPDDDWFCPVCQPTPRKMAKRRAPAREAQSESSADEEGSDSEDDEEPVNARRSKRAKRNLV